MLSNYLASLPLKNDIYVIYNTIVAEPVFVSLRELTDIFSECVSKEMKEILLKKGIYVTDIDIDKKRISSIRTKTEKQIGNIEFVTIILSDFCNLACDYCIEKQYNKHGGSKMSIDVMKKFFMLVSDGVIKIAPNVEFVLYGGEPLLNLEGIKYFLDMRQEMFPNSKCSIVTNAVLLNETIIRLFKENNVTIGISVDGPKIITDLHRKYKDSNRSVYDDIEKKVSLLKQNNASWGMSITITEELIRYKENFFEWLNMISPKMVTFNLLKLSHDTSDINKSIIYYKKTAKFLIEAHNRLLNMKILEREITRKIRYFIEQQPVISDCAAASLNQITINTDGNIYSCQCCLMQSNCFGNVFDMHSFAIPEECMEMYQKLPIYREECLKCSALPICGGGCLVQGKTMYDNSQYMDYGYCEYVKLIIQWVFENIYDSVI